MDTLTFAAPILYRHLTFSEAKKQPISEINLEKALEGLDMGMSQVGNVNIHNPTH
jgi:flap endonuclease-1